MKPLILVVENDKNVLKKIKEILERNECQIISANNGKKGLTILSEIDRNPDLIISDIIMPEMNGYDFLDAVSNSPTLSHIPFIFLSGLDSPEDIRLGKMLGADDYLTIPINEDDLTATIFGKLKRSKTINLINDKISEIYLSNQIEKELVSETDIDLTILIEVNWDDVVGPNLVDFFPKNIESDIPLDKIANQLYDVISSIYGQENISKAEGLLINIKNLDLMGYVFFDSYPDKNYRGGYKDYMLSIITPKITYFQSLKIKQIFIEISNIYKKKKKWNMEKFWNIITEILVTSSI